MNKKNVLKIRESEAVLELEIFPSCRADFS